MMRTFHRHVLLPAYESLYKRRRTFSYLKQLERTQWLKRDELDDLQLGALQRLIAHAAAHCPYYGNRWRQMGCEHGALRSLEDFRQWPVMDRSTINANRDQLRSQVPGIHLLNKSTGGSSGEPLHFSLNPDSNDRRSAMSHRGYAWAGAPPGAKLLYLWGVALGAQSRRQQWKDRLYHGLYRRSMLNCFDLSESRVAEFLAAHNARKPDVVVAYTNALYAFARMLDERGLQPYRPRAIIVGAEKLHDFQRVTIERVFGARVYETYGSREFMLIAAECERHEGLHLSHEHLLVEILDDDGKPVADGDEGQVVITDLYNWGMPFVRYMTGDRGIAGWTQCSCGRGLPLMKPIKGRELDIITTPDGRRLPGEFFPHLMKDFRSVKRFQVIQDTPDQVQMRIVAGANWSPADGEAVRRLAVSALGPLTQFQIVQVPDVPLTAAGKLRVVVNNCQKA